jgi:hypothetical protein
VLNTEGQVFWFVTPCSVVVSYHKFSIDDFETRVM